MNSRWAQYCSLSLGLLCAWVLWTKVLTVAGMDTPLIASVKARQWQPYSAHETKAECEKVAASGASDIKRALLVEHGLERYEGTLYARCLPDTIDPRGEKK